MSLLDGVEAVSWDVDGTLYEMPRMRRCLRRLVLSRALRGPWAVARDLRRLMGLRRAMEAVRASGGDLATLRAREPREALAPLEETLYGEAIRRAGPRPGVAEALAALRARGLRVVVLSDHPADFKLAALGFEGAFERVYVGEALGWLKPSPRPFAAVVEDLGLTPSALLHVGDRPDTDGRGAAAAGCRSVILPPGPLASALLR